MYYVVRGSREEGEEKGKRADRTFSEAILTHAHFHHHCLSFRHRHFHQNPKSAMPCTHARKGTMGKGRCTGKGCSRGRQRQGGRGPGVGRAGKARQAGRAGMGRTGKYRAGRKGVGTGMQAGMCRQAKAWQVWWQEGRQAGRGVVAVNACRETGRWQVCQSRDRKTVPVLLLSNCPNPVCPKRAEVYGGWRKQRQKGTGKSTTHKYHIEEQGVGCGAVRQEEEEGWRRLIIFFFKCLFLSETVMFLAMGIWFLVWPAVLFLMCVWGDDRETCQCQVPGAVGKGEVCVFGAASSSIPCHCFSV